MPAAMIKGGEGIADKIPSADRVPLKLSSTSTALFVVLTTKVAGRFSDNAFLIEAGNHSVDFIPWGTYGHYEHALLKASLRVKHLSENLFITFRPRTDFTWNSLQRIIQIYKSMLRR